MKKECFCSNCKHYRYFELADRSACLHPTPLFKDIANKKPDDYCPLHESKTVKNEKR